MSNQAQFSYLNPKVGARPCKEKGGYGVFALEALKKGELVTVWGGEVYTDATLDQVSVERATHGIQVEEGIYLLPLREDDPADLFNHSCDPNVGLSGHITLIAMRDIQAGEEVCFDYAMSDSSDYDEFECGCGAPTCRKKVTGGDWKLPELQVRYKGYFSPYLQRRIDAMSK